MKSFRTLAGFVATAVCALLIASPALAAPGLPGVGDFYMVNVHAYDNCPNGDFLDSNRRMIAVKANYTFDPEGQVQDINLDRTNQIYLFPGEDFNVLDGNACNKGGAMLQLPANISTTTYEVYVRLVGKPSTGIDVRTCADEAVDLDGDGIVEDIIMCSTERVIQTRGTGKPQAVRVTNELLTIYADVDGDGAFERVPLFDDSLENYFWQWNTVGQAKAQLIFVKQ